MFHEREKKKTLYIYIIYIGSVLLLGNLEGLNSGFYLGSTAVLHLTSAAFPAAYDVAGPRYAAT